MPRHPFIKATFPDPDLTPHKISKRLMLHLTRIRIDRAGVDVEEQDEETLYDLACMGKLEGVSMTPEDQIRTDRRAVRFYDRTVRFCRFLTSRPALAALLGSGPIPLSDCLIMLMMLRRLGSVHSDHGGSTSGTGP